MTHILRLLVIGIAASLVGGCIHLEQRVKIHSNGSAVVTYEYSIAEEAFGTAATGRLAIQEWQGVTKGGLSWFASERAVNDYFAGDLFEVQFYRITRKGARRHVRVVVLVKDLPKALLTGKLGDLRLEKTATGDWRLYDPTPKKTKDRTLTEQEVAKLRALCDDLWLRLVIETPTPVVSATTKDKEAKMVAWLFDAGQGDDFLRARPEIEVVFEGKD